MFLMYSVFFCFNLILIINLKPSNLLFLSLVLHKDTCEIGPRLFCFKFHLILNDHFDDKYKVMLKPQ
jgi:hypothetical protein